VLCGVSWFLWFSVSYMTDMRVTINLCQGNTSGQVSSVLMTFCFWFLIAVSCMKLC
jgi:hypothetical protein